MSCLSEEGRSQKVPRAQAILQQHPHGYRQGDHATENLSAEDVSANVNGRGRGGKCK